MRRGEASLFGFARRSIFTGRAVQGDLKRDAPLADGLPEKNVARSGQAQTKFVEQGFGLTFSSGSIGMVRFVGVEAIVPTPFRALWKIVPRKQE